MKNKINTSISVCLTLLFLIKSLIGFAHSETTPNSPIQISKDRKLSYKTAENGDRVLDFSYCGFMASEKPIPSIPVKLIVPALNGDATSQIQTAIDYFSSLPLDQNGFRGTILLEKGTFAVKGRITIRASGVVLRGSGCDNDGTILLGSGVDRESLIRITGTNNRVMGKSVQLADKYFPVNSTLLTFKNGHPFKVGDQVMVNRPSTKEWLEKIGTDKIGIYVDYTLTKWEPGDFDQNWYRTVVEVTPETITIDIPLTNSLHPQYGGATVTGYNWQGQIKNVGVENLRCASTFDSANTKDENHRWMAITLENVSDSWVRRIVAEHFVSSAVAVWETARRITVEDCKSLSPIGEIGNYRRYSFHTLGQQVLFQRCYAEFGYHAFSVGFTSPGPNAFVQCYSYMPYNFSGSTRPSELMKPSPNLVRFVPGRTGRGLTDDLDTLVSDMLKNRVVVMQNFPALWYERRRDDHARTRRANADTWAPFYEQPFSRSGQGEAFDRLSKYDLTKWNSWYWLRLKKIADLADQNGLLFFQEHYLQHNIIEEGAHWADYPWRSANNVNNPIKNPGNRRNNQFN